jgi:1-acyl-sn-glycerol-3-phosphate acyltransferase
MIIKPTPTTTPEIEAVTDVLFNQILSVMGLKHLNWISKFLFLILSSPIKRMSGMLVELDENIAQKGGNQAAKEFMSYFVNDVNLLGAENIPEQGPLLLMCNHPAAYDVIILAACIRRDDLKILGSDVQFIKKFPKIANLIIPVPYHVPSRLQTVRASINHLKNGGAVLIFPRGDVEPDPAVSPGAEHSLDGWSASLELFLRKVPQTISIVAIASGILSKKWFKNPVIKLWKKYEQRQKVAEIFQIATQLITGKMPKTTPMVSFSPPLSIDDLGGENAPGGTLLANLIEQARQLLANHPHS